MKTVYFVIILCFAFETLPAQKKAIDFSALDSWPEITQEKLSNDGKYIIYNISSNKDGTELIIQSTDSSWKIGIRGATSALITEDNKHVIFKSSNDSLGIVEPEKMSTDLLEKVVSYKVPPEGNGKWIAYLRKEQPKDLILLNLFDGERKSYSNTIDFAFSAGGESLFLQERSVVNDNEVDSLVLVDLNTGFSHFVSCGKEVCNWAIDRTGSQIAFLTERNENGKKRNLIWYYKIGIDSARVLVSDSTAGLEGMALSRNQLSFSDDGNNLFFSAHRIVRPVRGNDRHTNNNLIIWSYNDKILTESPESDKPEREFAAVFNLQFRKKVIKLEEEDDDFPGYGQIKYSNNRVLIFRNFVGTLSEYNWRSSARPDLYLVSTEDGSRKLLKSALYEPLQNEVGFSPSGKYVFWFDRVKAHWFCFNMRTGWTKNITSNIPFSLANNYAAYASFSPTEGMAGWIKNDAAVLIYDNYDVWMVDPEGIKAPINLTLGYGRKYHITFRYLNFEGNRPDYFGPRDTLILYAFNTVTKDNGFAELKLSEYRKFHLLTMQSINYFYNYMRGGPAFEADPYIPIACKSRNANCFAFVPSRADMYPNIRVTKDLIHFKQLSNLAPQKEVNWYANELIQWKLPNGTANEGILFKPEDFDPKKKYPLILYIYERFADGLNVFLKPRLMRNDLNIPWYVSHGYMVLAPDIHYTIGHPGESAYNSVISAIQYLSTKSWYDSKKLGIQGHSYGSYEINYIVTRTNIFTAAVSADGPCDIISRTGQITGGTGRHWFYEAAQGRMGATLWERPDLYIENSPIMRANKVTTPLLIIQNTLDNATPLAQGVEWFTGLRRLGKTVWMLQYTNENHSIEHEDNQLDYTIRLDQFFDHFLKGAPAPQWMTQGVNPGFDLDNDAKGR